MSAEVCLVAMGTAMVAVTPIVVLPVAPGMLLMLPMVVGVAMVFAGLLLGWKSGQADNAERS